MVVEWDYTAAADVYDTRPSYAADVLAECLRTMGVETGMRACDVGAGTGHLTLPLLGRGLRVVAVEPNPAMRRRGRMRTAGRGSVAWIAAVGEALPLAGASCDLVGFGSSFNVVDRPQALRESARILEPRGSLLCLWNHRRLDDPLQERIEALICECVPGYIHGVRREDQSETIERSGLFRCVGRVEGAFVHRAPVDEWLRTWRSHLTLRRQAGARFEEVVAAIGRVVGPGVDGWLEIPYVTRAWVAQRTAV